MEFFASFSIAYIVYLRRRRIPTSESPHYNTRTVKPPFPPALLSLLEHSSLAYLSTTDGASPHLSLMNFTFDADRGAIIMTTRKNTLKAKLLVTNPNVAMLVHDFPTRRGISSSEFEQTYSVTLYGHAKFVEDEATSDELRALHSKRNPQSSAFISGPEIGVMTINITSASICDSSDKVTNWKAEEELKVEVAARTTLSSRRFTFSDLTTGIPIGGR